MPTIQRSACKLRGRLSQNPQQILTYAAWSFHWIPVIRYGTVSSHYPDTGRKSCISLHWHVISIHHLWLAVGPSGMGAQLTGLVSEKDRWPGPVWVISKLQVLRFLNCLLNGRDPWWPLYVWLSELWLVVIYGYRSTNECFVRWKRKWILGTAQDLLTRWACGCVGSTSYADS